jgi:hypothetical protein
MGIKEIAARLRVVGRDTMIFVKFLPEPHEKAERWWSIRLFVSSRLHNRDDSYRFHHNGQPLIGRLLTDEEMAERKRRRNTTE